MNRQCVDHHHHLVYSSLTHSLGSPLTYAVLPSLLPLVTTPDPSLRHGALHAVAELTHALYTQAQSSNTTLDKYLRTDVTSALAEVVPRV